jgi:dTDP-4-dehydrorhamnose reductase
MLGKKVVKELEEEEEVIPTDIEELDVTKRREVSVRIKKINPQIILHLAAYTDVDGCEIEKEKAWQVNSLGVKNVSEVANELDIPLLYISTDYIFDGKKPIPYVEWDEANPLSVYGKSKYMGEVWVKVYLKNYWIIRTSGLYGEGGKNFVDTILKKSKESKKIRIVRDQIGSPTYTKDLAFMIKKLINTQYFGIYHLTNSGWTSWYNFGKKVVELANLHVKVIPITSSHLSRPAKRPKNFRLLNFMWGRIFGEKMRNWEEALYEYIKNNRRKYTG